jgi:hypothetical protein
LAGGEVTGKAETAATAEANPYGMTIHNKQTIFGLLVR